MRLLKRRKILGIDFLNEDTETVVEILKSGGLLVVPSGPGLVTIKEDLDYYNSLLAADVVIADSGYMVFLWNIIYKEKIRRISGLEFLSVFLSDDEIKKTSSFLLVDPKLNEAVSNLSYLNSIGFKLDDKSSYLAPIYSKGKVEDERLLSLIESKRPRFVIINLGGGVQEKLGAYLKRHLSYEPAIICTGAAIAFLTGQQARIPVWADRLFLGWLFRCIENPRLFIPRYAKAVRLLSLILRYGKNAPT